MAIISTQAEFDSVFVTNISTIPQNEPIYIKSGTYTTTAPIIINKSNITIVGIGPTKPAIVPMYTSTTGGDEGIFTFLGTSSATLSNITVRNLQLGGLDETTKVGKVGIVFKYVGSAPATNGLYTGTYSRYDATTAGHEITTNTFGFRLHDCVIQNIAAEGIEAAWSANSVIKNNTVTNIRAQGIFVASSRQILIKRNNITDTGMSSIAIVNSAANIISSNNIKRSSTDGIYVVSTSTNPDSNTNVVTSNYIDNCTIYSIWLKKAANTVVSGNTIIGGGPSVTSNGTGIVVHDSESNAITANNAIGCAQGIQSVNSTQSVYNSNSIINSGQRGIMFGGSSTGNAIVNNSITRTDTSSTMSTYKGVQIGDTTCKRIALAGNMEAANSSSSGNHILSAGDYNMLIGNITTGTNAGISTGGTGLKSASNKELPSSI